MLIFSLRCVRRSVDNYISPERLLSFSGDIILVKVRKFGLTLLWVLYYNKIDICHKSGNSNELIEFILLMLNEVLDEVLLSSQKESRHISEQVNKLLEVMDDEIPYRVNELLLNIK